MAGRKTLPKQRHANVWDDQRETDIDPKKTGNKAGAILVKPRNGWLAMISRQTLDKLVVAFAVVATALVLSAYVAVRLSQIAPPASAIRPIEGTGPTAPPLPAARWA
jgi:hypothetical protein